MSISTGYLKNYLRQHMVGPLTPAGEYDEENLMLLAKGISNIDPSSDEDTEDYQYYDGNGGKETEVTSASLSHAFSGNRYYGDNALEFIRDMLTKTNGRTCSFKVIEPDGRIISGKATVSEIKPYGGDAGARSEIEFTITFDGMPRDSKEDVVPTAVNVDSSTKTVEVGATTTIVATVLPANASQEVTFTSKDDTVATVSSAGVVTGIKEGTVEIDVTTVENPQIKATVAVTVTAAA
ncbi:phage tail tube protein [Listeria innocua]|uniref:phage tail tube protein n=1 Tax=Listeria innocua TaxID=1642 RepID=UPI0021AD8AF7|nr:Ig-like domain-containing protein [Listeria innocua]